MSPGELQILPEFQAMIINSHLQLRYDFSVNALSNHHMSDGKGEDEFCKRVIFAEPYYQAIR